MTILGDSHVAVAPRRIHALDPALAARIAAGEVIERPASVVKELLENALDAGAGTIRVEVAGGGLDRLAVIDDGSGIAADQVELAFARHATSKLASLEDLESIATLGFRGEALPSIAAVSSVTLRTRQASAPAGVQVTLREGTAFDRRTIGLPVGTSIEVRELFANLPARRKFLKGAQAELSAIHQVVLQYAIAYPGVCMTLLVEGKSVLSTAGARDLTETLACLYGVDIIRHLVPVNGERHGLHIQGLVSHVGYTKATRVQQSFFVNGRWVRNRVLHIALEEAYHGMLMGGRHPVGVLFVQAQAADLDLNVHPAKTEIRFMREREVFGAIRHTVALAINQRTAVAPSASDLESGEQTFEQLTLPGDIPGSTPPQGAIVAPARAMPTLRVLGQAGSLFIIAEGPDGVYMVDQHAAHERVLFDDFCEQAARSLVSSQSLLEPLLCEVGSSAMEIVVDEHLLLEQMGFLVEPFGVGTCRVRAVPTMLAEGAIGEILQSLLEDLTQGKAHEERRDQLLAGMSCKAAVKAGQTLSMEEMRYLVQRLEGTSRPRTCPHGRPTMILLSTTDLERQFGRR
jgi:DNA mismatch repair protein MutL